MLVQLFPYCYPGVWFSAGARRVCNAARGRLRRRSIVTDVSRGFWLALGVLGVVVGVCSFELLPPKDLTPQDLGAWDALRKQETTSYLSCSWLLNCWRVAKVYRQQKSDGLGWCFYHTMCLSAHVVFVVYMVMLLFFAVDKPQIITCRSFRIIMAFKRPGARS